MNTVHSSIAAAVSCVGLVLGAQTAVAANHAGEALTATVEYGDLDVSSRLGAAKLYARLRAAARNVCAPFEGRELYRRALWNSCFNQALSNAVIQVNREAVTALHQHAMHADRAS